MGEYERLKASMHRVLASQQSQPDPLAEQAVALSRADAQTYGDYMALAAEGEPDFIELAAESQRQDAELELTGGGESAIELARRREARKDPSICGNPDAYGRCGSAYHSMGCGAAADPAAQRLSFADKSDRRAVKLAERDAMVTSVVSEMALEDIESGFTSYRNQAGEPFRLVDVVNGRVIPKVATLRSSASGAGQPMPPMTGAARAMLAAQGVSKDPAPW